jgi:POT family proton-dependent oligopeptide transporter
VLAAIGGVAFWLDNRNIDKEEDKMNLLPEAHFKSREPVADVESAERDSTHLVEGEKKATL